MSELKKVTEDQHIASLTGLGLSMAPTSLRIPLGMLERADSLIAVLAKEVRRSNMVGLSGPVRRSNVLRLALIRGIEVLESEYAAE